jgi:hypothetical protein
MAKSKLDEKRENKKKKEKSPLAKAVELVVRTIRRAVEIFLFILIGTLVVAQARIAQTGLLPDCETAKPYQPEGEANPQQIHLDYISNKDNSGAMRSIKATYPINYNIKLIHESYMFKVINTLTKGPDSSVIGNYIGLCLTTMTQGYISLHNSLLSTVNSLLPEIGIVILGNLIQSVIGIVTLLYSLFAGIFSFFQNVKYFYYKKELVEVDGSQESRWEEGDFGLWDYENTWNFLWSLLIYFSLLMGLAIIIPTCLLWTFIVSLTVFFMPFFLLRIYSTEDDINSAINKKAEKFTHGGDGDIMSGGADDENDNESDNDEESKTEETGNASDEEDEMMNGQPHPGLPKRFSFISHFKKFIKVYKHILLYIFALFLVIDILSIFGPYAMALAIFSIIVVWYFGSLFEAYKIKDSDKFTTFLMGTTQAKKECKVPFVKKGPDDTYQKKWYFLWLL